MSLPACPFAFDLMAYLRNNPKKQRALLKSVDTLKAIEARLARGEPVTNEFKAELSKLIKLSGYNLGLIIPYLFPAYPDDTPLSLIARPYMFALLSMAGDSIVTFRAGRQVGKCSAGDQTLSTNKGQMSLEGLFLAGTVV